MSVTTYPGEKALLEELKRQSAVGIQEDIVDRLIRIASQRMLVENVSIYYEAADEIKRLRKELGNIHDD